jgi:hypothetical protein
MSMIFEKFTSVQDAAAFIAKVQELHLELHCQMFTDSNRPTSTTWSPGNKSRSSSTWTGSTTRASASTNW